MLSIVSILLIAGALAFLATMLVIKNLIYICGPNEVLIFSGAARRDGAGVLRGYRIVKGGRGIRIPLFERVSRMDLTNIIIDLRVTGAYCKGGIPLTVEGVANIKVAGDEPTIHNALERFLGKSREQIKRIAKETLEGNLRGVLATLTPEQVNDDKIAFSKSLLAEASEDLTVLGLTLDSLQIQNISDEVKYLDSIGRKQSAEIIRDARVAEATAHAVSVCRSAENKQKTVFAQIDADEQKVRAEARRRIVDAQTKRVAVVAEVEADVGSQVARSHADVAVQEARIEQVRRRLQADVVAPAEANASKRIEHARADAAKIMEDGKALVDGLSKLIASWNAAGSNAREIFLLQKLELLIGELISTIADVDIDGVTMIDGSGGTAAKTASFLEQLKHASGVDVAGVVRTFAAANETSTNVRDPA